MTWAQDERRRKQRDARKTKRFLALEQLPVRFGGDHPLLESIEALRKEAVIRRKYRRACRSAARR
jgi:hypothetical protein